MNDPTKIERKEPKHLPSTTLYILLAILCGIWLLCYTAEKNLIPVSLENDLLHRLNINKGSQKDYQLAVSSLYAGHQGYSSIDDTNSNGNTKSLCVVVNHRSTNENWYGSLISVIGQKQSLSQLKLFYMNNKRGSSQIEKYLSTNAIHSSSIEFYSPNFIPRNFWDIVVQSKAKCAGFEHVLLMDDSMTFVEKKSLAKLMEIMGESNQLGYGGLAVVDQGKNHIKFGHSFPYPESVIKETKYKSYPLVLNGPILITIALLQKLACSYCNYLMDKSVNLKPAVYIEMLEKAQGKLVYLNGPITMVEEQHHQNFLSNSQSKKLLAQISKIEVN